MQSVLGFLDTKIQFQNTIRAAARVGQRCTHWQLGTCVLHVVRDICRVPGYEAEASTSGDLSTSGMHVLTRIRSSGTDGTEKDCTMYIQNTEVPRYVHLRPITCGVDFGKFQVPKAQNQKKAETGRNLKTEEPETGSAPAANYCRPMSRGPQEGQACREPCACWPVNMGGGMPVPGSPPTPQAEGWEHHGTDRIPPGKRISSYPSTSYYVETGTVPGLESGNGLRRARTYAEHSTFYCR